jgi:rhodanese-related sulfurtransferase
MRTRANILDQPPARSQSALLHFTQKLAYEADCADVYADMLNGVEGFTVLDTRSAERYSAGHIPGAVHLPHRRITHEALAQLGVPEDHLLVTYCAGAHCNASTRGAIRAAELGRAVKEMPGGLLGWRAEGFPVAVGSAPSELASVPRSIR